MLKKFLFIWLILMAGCTVVFGGGALIIFLVLKAGLLFGPVGAFSALLLIVTGLMALFASVD